MGLTKNEKKFADKLLYKTARSFYLTINALPDSIRWPLTVTYLLARATDTVADELNLPAKERLSLLHQMQNMIVNYAEWENHTAINLVKNALDLHIDKYNLLFHFHEIVNWLNKFDEETIKNILHVLTTIIHGQQFDIDHFPGTGSIACIKTEAELDNYTYLVAGCVGEFWTKLCINKIKNYSHYSLNILLSLALAFGKGLQLLNILRDLPQDISKGRCYLPYEQLKQFDIDINHIQHNIQLLEPLVKVWQKKVEKDLQAGWLYILSLNHRHIRAALAIPILLGFATLKILQQEPYLTNKQPVKVSRWQVRLFTFIAVLSLLSRRFFLLTRFTSISSYIIKIKYEK